MYPFVFTVVVAAVAAYGAVFFASALFAPRFFLRALDFPRHHIDGGRVRVALTYMRIALVVLGLGLLFYHAAEVLVAFIPADLGGFDEDGEWQSTRQSLQGLIGFGGGLACALRAGEVAETLASEPYERAARKAVFDALRSSNVPLEIRDHVMKKVEGELLERLALWPNRYAAEICLSLRRALDLPDRDYSRYDREI